MPRLGQHFLTDANYLERVAAAAALEPDDRVLEIGPGTGLLTRKLLEAGCRVVAIEVDPALARGLHKQLADLDEAGHPGELYVVQDDAVKADWPRFDKLVSNLPYGISSPVLFRLLDTDYALAVLTLQREFAERLVARAGSTTYGRLSVKAALKAHTELLFRIPPGAFDPPPRVDSACVRVEPIEPPDVRDWTLLDALVDKAFQHRRKMLRKSLKHEDDAVPVLEAMGLAKTRPERLPPADWVQLANQVHAARGG